MRLADRVAIITGAAQGLGYAYAQRFLAEGARVVLADRNEELGDRAAKELAEAGEAVFLPVDVADPGRAGRLVAETERRFGRVDVLINNAAVWDGIEIQNDSLDYLRRVLDVNMYGPWIMSDAVVPVMARQGKGKIVNVASIGAWVYLGASVGVTPGASAATDAGEGLATFHYNWSKWNVIGLTRFMAGYVGRLGITVNCVAPGASNTPSNAAFAEGMEMMRAMVALRRIVEPEDLAGVMAFLASDDSDLITGQTIVVDAGFHMG